jgi:predicted transcriptional regulator
MIDILRSLSPTRSLIAGLATAMLFAPTLGVATTQSAFEQSDRHAKVSRLVTTLFERSHYRQVRVDDSVSSRVLDRYIEVMDANRHYFLVGDIDDFETYRFELDDAVKRGELDAISMRLHCCRRSRTSLSTRPTSSIAASMPGQNLRTNSTRYGASGSRMMPSVSCWPERPGRRAQRF